MESFLLLLRLLLAAVFIAAATAKLRDRGGARKTLTDFGAPRWLAGPTGAALPFAELATAGLLLPARYAFWGGVAALVLLSLFTVAVAVNLARGRSPDCRCFGTLHSRPIGRRTLARNAALALGAALVAWTAGAGSAPSLAGLFEPARDITPPDVGMIIAIAGLSWFVLLLFRQQGRLLLRLDALEGRLLSGDPGVPPVGFSPGLPVGAPAPRLIVRSLAGESVPLETLWAGRHGALLIFTDPGCAPCLELLPEIARWQSDRAWGGRITVISSGAAEDVRSQVTSANVASVFMQEGTSVADAYAADGTPAAVLVRPDGTIGSELRVGPEAIEKLLKVAHAAIDPGPALA